MIVNGGCSECGNYHRLDFLVCPTIGRPEPRAATPPPPVVSVDDQLREREILARGERNRKAVEHEKLWAKIKPLVRAAVEEQRRVDQAELRQDLRDAHTIRDEQEEARRLRKKHAMQMLDRPAASAPAPGKAGPSTAFTPDVAEQVKKDDTPVVPGYPKKMEVAWTRDRHGGAA